MAVDGTGLSSGAVSTFFLKRVVVLLAQVAGGDNHVTLNESEPIKEEKMLSLKSTLMLGTISLRRRPAARTLFCQRARRTALVAAGGR